MSQNLPLRTNARGYVDGPNGQIHYWAMGEGPVLVLAHQSPLSGRMFERAMPLLAERGICAVAVDTPGFGNSDVPSVPPTIPDYTAAYLAVLDGLGLASAHLLGHHTGAMILAHLAAQHPQRARSLVMNGVPWLSQEDLKAFEKVEAGPDPIHEDGSHLKQAWDRRIFFTPGYSDLVAMHRRLVEQLWAGDTAWYGHAAAFSHDMQPDLEALAIPTAILTNTGDDIHHLVPKVRALRPDFDYIELVGGTHDIVDEQPEAWSEAVAAYVHAQERLSAP